MKNSEERKLARQSLEKILNRSSPRRNTSTTLKFKKAIDFISEFTSIVEESYNENYLHRL